MSIEDLMEIRVKSVSKKEQRLSRAASAVFVITAEDIRRSGATNIPDLLRMVPGLDVAQVNSSTWAISSRGFNDEAANKLLVLIDGRTVYSPLFGGVFWDVQQIPLEIIERIEVIRGPGAAVWGANAVNGVINIITKKASDTQGGLISGGGTYDQGFGTALFGGKLRNDTYYRAFVNGFNQNHFIGLAAQNGHDAWDVYRTGFRVDSKLGAKDSITFQGDAYNGSEGEVVAAVTSLVPPQPQILNLRLGLGGWDLLSRWDRAISSTSETTLQVYFDRTNRGDSTYGEGRDTFDVDFQHHIGWGSRQDFVWGLGYRATSDSIRGSLRVTFNPPGESNRFSSSFVQDEIAIIPQSLYFTIGTKLEHNPFTGFGVQPDARIAWLANHKNMFWASVSRAMRTPTRDEDVRFNQIVNPGPNGLPLGSPALQWKLAPWPGPRSGNGSELEAGQPVDSQFGLLILATAYPQRFDKHGSRIRFDHRRQQPARASAVALPFRIDAAVVLGCLGLFRRTPACFANTLLHAAGYKLDVEHWRRAVSQRCWAESSPRSSF